MKELDLAKLSEPFPAIDVEWRVQSCGDNSGKIWAIVIPYIQNRAIMDRLDKICGPERWRNEYVKGPEGGILCGLSIKVGDEWVTKWDGAANTEVKEGGKLDEDTNIKGGLSASMKRAGVQWGIGRYLYNLEASFADVANEGRNRGKTKEGKTFRWNPPRLPPWALPAGTKQAEPEAAQKQTAPETGKPVNIAALKQDLIDYVNEEPAVLNAAWIDYANKAMANNSVEAMQKAIAEAQKNKGGQ